MQVSSIGFGSFGGIAAYRLPKVTSVQKTPAKSSASQPRVNASDGRVQAAVLTSAPVKRPNYPTYQAAVIAKPPMNEVKTKLIEGFKEVGKKLASELVGAGVSQATREGLSRLPGLGKTTISMTTIRPGFPVYVGTKAPTAGAEILSETAGGLASAGAKGAVSGALGGVAKSGVTKVLGAAAAGPVGIGVSVVSDILLNPAETADDAEENAATSRYLNQQWQYKNSQQTLYKPNPDTAQSRTVTPPGNARFRLRSMDA